MEWISTALGDALETAPAALDVSVLVHVTSRRGGTADRPRSVSPLSMVSMIEFPAVQVVGGRPDFSTLLREEAEGTTGRMSVTGAFLGGRHVQELC